VLGLDAPPSAVRGWVLTALELADVRDIYTAEGDVLGTTPGGGRVLVQLAAPMGLPSTHLAVTTVTPGEGPHADPPGEFRARLEEVTPQRVTVERVPGESEDGAAVSVAWERLGREPAVSPTGRYSLGETVHEVEVEGRAVTAELVRADATLGAVQAAVGTPLRSVRRGTGGEYYVVGDEVVCDAFGDDALSAERVADLLETVGGTLSVDDRLGVVRHVVDPFEDPAVLRGLAEGVVAVARAVEDDT